MGRCKKLKKNVEVVVWPLALAAVLLKCGTHGGGCRERDAVIP
jgi:hypothetical protein